MYHLISSNKLPKKAGKYICIMKRKETYYNSLEYIPMMCHYEPETNTWSDIAYNNEYTLLNRTELYAWCKIKPFKNISFYK